MTQPIPTDTIWVTQPAYDRLQQELDHLRGDVRADITAKISAARDEGDLKENGGYHAAREEQGKTEARIRQLEDMLRRAEVGDKPADDGLVEAGMTATNGRPTSRAKYASLTAVEPLEASMTVEPQWIQPLHSA